MLKNQLKTTTSLTIQQGLTKRVKKISGNISAVVIFKFNLWSQKLEWEYKAQKTWLSSEALP